MAPVGLSIDDLDGPLPFHLLLDASLGIESAGRTLRKLIPALAVGEQFTDHFELLRPHSETDGPDSIEAVLDRLVLVQAKDADLQLRGSFWKLEAGGYLLAGSPLMNKAEDMEQLGLIMTDFAPHDPVTDFLFAIRARDVTLDEIRSASDRQKLLTRELDHRVKNTLAAVLTLASLTSGESTSIEQFNQRFEGRVRTMSMAHELLATAGWNAVDLEDMVLTVLGGFLQNKSSGLEFSGEPVTIAPRQAGPLAMTLHELGMNAFKYGAWADGSGSISVTWQLQQDTIRIDWHETGGPRIESTPKHGIGLNLVSGFIKHELHGDISLDFETDGLTANISFPFESATT